jgi:hypothetical protein
MISHGSNVIILDQKTGEYWQKFQSQNEGSTIWEKSESPTK